MQKETIQELKQRLLEKKSATEQTIADLALDLDQSQSSAISELSTYDNHPADIATETYERSKDFALREQQLAVLDEIEVALKRIEDGSYGCCTSCGKEIPEERLLALPEASRCLACQESQEDPVRERPIEESLIDEMYRNSFTDGATNESVIFDGEDTWQAVARYGTSNTPGDFRQVEHYNDVYIDSDERIGIVFEEDALPASYDRSRGEFIKNGSHVGIEKRPLRHQGRRYTGKKRQP